MGLRDMESECDTDNQKHEQLAEGAGRRQWLKLNLSHNQMLVSRDTECR